MLAHIYVRVFGRYVFVVIYDLRGRMEMMLIISSRFNEIAQSATTPRKEKIEK